MEKCLLPIENHKDGISCVTLYSTPLWNKYAKGVRPAKCICLHSHRIDRSQKDHESATCSGELWCDKNKHKGVS